jgi:hypothetical protein
VENLRVLLQRKAETTDEKWGSHHIPRAGGVLYGATPVN